MSVKSYSSTSMFFSLKDFISLHGLLAGLYGILVFHVHAIGIRD